MICGVFHLFLVRCVDGVLGHLWLVFVFVLATFGLLFRASGLVWDGVSLEISWGLT